MTTGRYDAYRSADAQLTEPGYSKAWISLVADFTTLNEPTLSTIPLIGEKNIIDTDHVWATGKEAIPVYIKKEAFEADGESTGDAGSLRLMYSPKIFVIGDGPVILEMIQNWLNEEMIIFAQDGCGTTKQFIQFGCDCLPVTIQKASVKSGTLKSGAKGYEITFESYCKYFYNGTVSEKA